ncbi:MFS transporter [Clostridium estertheticum]|uniref:MFS transporter n=1 Tax=Clostridium estertheticum TaxID=238834 RepID=UPI0013EE4365|nr:MFS transporter [Clostridium estertheticum]MBZ9609642.1 MFS transporter [Clostridium estertheticum]
MNLKPLREKNFIVLMFGKFISLIGSTMQTFALSLYVLNVTGSATKFAAVTAVGIIPRVILGPIAGVFADWFDRKKLIVYADIISGIIIGIYWIVYKLNGCISLTSIYVLAIIMAVINSVFLPAISTIIPSIVENDDLVEANGVDSFILTVGNVLAPILAGILFSIYGLIGILLVNSVSFILSGVSEMFIIIPKLSVKSNKLSVKSFLTDFGEGIAFIKQKKLILTIITLALFINFILYPIFGLGITYISKEIFKITDFQYGILQSTLFAALLISTVVVGKISKVIKPGKIIFLSIFSSALVTGVIAVISTSAYVNLFSSNIIPYISIIIAGCIIGMIMNIASITVITIIQKEVPLSMMGRVSAVMSAGCMAAIPIGQMIFGIFFDTLEAWACVTIGSLMLLIIILAFRSKLIKEPPVDLEV